VKRLLACLFCALFVSIVAPVAHAQDAPAATPAAEISSHFAGVSPTTSPSRPLGKVLGLLALTIVLVLFSEGFGILGGRIRNLASRPPTPQEELPPS
jgi:hypothetical protein